MTHHLQKESLTHQIQNKLNTETNKQVKTKTLRVIQILIDLQYNYWFAQGKYDPSPHDNIL